MSKRKRDVEKAKKARARQVKQQAKAKREQHDPEKWERKKQQKEKYKAVLDATEGKSTEQKIALVQKMAKQDAFPGLNEECPLPMPVVPTPVHCKRCKLECPYNRHC